MERAIEEIYSELLHARRERDPGYERMFQSIEEAARRRETSLRTDAVYFIANNVSEMIFRPVRLARERRASLDAGQLASEAELYSALQSDLDVIIELARSAAHGRERSHVSAASVIVGLGHVIDGLKINDWKLWGRST